MYFRPLNCFNIGKKSEYAERKCFNISKALERINEDCGNAAE